MFIRTYSDIPVIKFWVALFWIIHVVRARGVPYFGACPEARANLLGKQPRSNWEKTEHQAILRNIMHKKKNSQYININIICDWPKSVPLKFCSLTHLNLFFFQSYCDGIILLLYFKHMLLFLSSKRKTGEREKRERGEGGSCSLRNCFHNVTVMWTLSSV